jgi:DNA processing protein
MPADTQLLDTEDLRCWVALSLIHGVGGETFRRLLAAFGAPQQIFAMPTQRLREVVDSNIAAKIGAGVESSPVLEATLSWLQQPGNTLLTLADAAYPQALLEIADPPPMLYCKGDLSFLNRPAIAVVGSRNATPQGLKTTEAFSQAFCEAGWCVVSGLALGVDGAAHRGALQAKVAPGYGGTIAVVGTGLDIVYPARHRELAHEVVQHGVMISEFPLGTASIASNFPRRNRIISGLARGVLVVEANLHSGSLITARLAAEQGRDVFAIPGSIHSPLSKGCHLLIKQGAKLVDSIHDVLEELGSAPTSDLSATADDMNEHSPLLELLGYDAVATETLIQRSGLTSEQVSTMLLSLELEGKVASLPGGRYQRI